MYTKKPATDTRAECPQHIHGKPATDTRAEHPQQATKFIAID